MDLSEDQKKILFKSQNKAGFIFHAYSEDARKNKFLIIVGQTEDALLIGHVLINSLINENYAPTPELQTLHMPIYAKDYDFLSHDSYIDCSRLYDIEYNKIETIYITPSGGYKGVLTQNDISSLKYMIKNSPTIEKKTKGKYGYK